MDAVQTIKQHMTKDIIRRLLEQNNAQHVVDNGDNFRCTCPIHKGDNQTAFTWNYMNGLWYCFTGDCGGGDIFDFIADIYDLSVEHEFIDVVKKTAEVLSIDISDLEMGQRRDVWIRENRMWLDYMASKHRPKNQAFNLNTLGTLFDLTSYRNFTKDTIDHFRALYSDVYKRIVVPIYDMDNTLVGASLRRTNSEEKIKWLHRPKHINTGQLLYNANNVTGQHAIIVEGAFDVWNLYQIGVEDAVATFGSHLTEEQRDIIAKRYTDIDLMYDSDKAGQEATAKALGTLRHICNVRVIDLGDIHDPGEVPDRQTFDSLKRLKPYEYDGVMKCTNTKLSR
jgi:DNA primase